MTKIDGVWDKVGKKPHHGINLPLSALHSEKSSGIGEFLDLLPLISWVSDIGMDVIQLLPLNDSGHDPSPYNALSASALHPIYLSLHALPGDKPDLPSFDVKKKIPYEEVLTKKLEWLKEYHLRNPADTENFVRHFPWMRTYALFKVLKEEYGGSRWEEWPITQPSKTELKHLYTAYHDKMQFHIALQYHCYNQLSQVRQEAEAKGVLLKGDIPILISPDSADVWAHPEYFDLSMAAGAPPDTFNAEGQYWGFPIYKWDVLAHDNYAWWKERLAFAAELYHLYRIDHVIGFFRIWAITRGHPPKDGKFVPEETDLMLAQGRTLLEMMIDSAPILPIAEDLGVVPDSVRDSLKELEICGMKVFRWERMGKDHKEYTPYSEYHPITMTTVSTHDSTTLQLWWEEDADDAMIYANAKAWHYAPEITFNQRLSILKDNHHTPSFFHVNLLQEYLALYPDLVWEDPQDERINIPGFILPENWTYRFRPSLEEIITHAPLKKLMAEIIM